MKPLLFVSANNTWGGSEILWSDTAALLAGKGYRVKFGVKYTGNPIIGKLLAKGASYINLTNSGFPSRKERVLRKLKLRVPPKEAFLQAVTEEEPHLVIISQGNNVDGRHYMKVCREQQIPYVTITQLVTEVLLLFINDEIINELRQDYLGAKVNYFVSTANLELHKAMLGDVHSNSKIVQNPFTVPSEIAFAFPKAADPYQVAVVARLETFHKGQDILLNVLRQSKWKERPIVFNFYGTGPHRELLQRYADQHELTNVVFKGHVEDVAGVWEKNQMLVLPSRMEGQSLALIEAMWCSRGAIVTDVGGACELVTEGETGFVALLPTASDIDAALERAWLLKDRWEDMGKAAGKKIRDVYQRNPIEVFSEEIIGIVEELQMHKEPV